MKLSEKLMKLRKERGLSQEEFGNEINVSRQAVSKWENEEARPDVDKIKEIVKKFNVSYEYLLNDELEIDEETKKFSESEGKKPKSRILQKVVLGLILLYLLVCIYKFVAFYRFFLIANSFSEENYWMSQSLKTSNELMNNLTINREKVGNRMLETAYSWDEQSVIKDENGENLPYDIYFTDVNERICYQLHYDKEKEGYIYHDRKEDMVNGEEIEGLFNLEDRSIKENTLSVIPSGFKEIFLASIDPRYYYVSIKNRQIRAILFADDIKIKVVLTQDCLIDTIVQKLENGEFVESKFSYDYVQDHFDEMKDPRELESYKILYEEE